MSTRIAFRTLLVIALVILPGTRVFSQSKLSEDTFTSSVKLLNEGKLKESSFSSSSSSEKKTRESETFLRLSRKQHVSYASLRSIARRIIDSQGNNVEMLHSFISAFVKLPKHSEYVDLD